MINLAAFKDKKVLVQLKQPYCFATRVPGAQYPAPATRLDEKKQEQLMLTPFIAACTVVERDGVMMFQYPDPSENGAKLEVAVDWEMIAAITVLSESRVELIGLGN